MSCTNVSFQLGCPPVASRAWCTWLVIKLAFHIGPGVKSSYRFSTLKKYKYPFCPLKKHNYPSFGFSHNYPNFFNLSSLNPGSPFPWFLLESHIRRKNVHRPLEGLSAGVEIPFLETIHLVMLSRHDPIPWLPLSSTFLLVPDADVELVVESGWMVNAPS